MNWFCSCGIAAAVAGISLKGRKLNNFSSNSLTPNLVRTDSVTIWIDSKGYCWCISNAVATAAGLYLAISITLEKTTNWIIREVIYYT